VETLLASTGWATSGFAAGRCFRLGVCVTGEPAGADTSGAVTVSDPGLFSVVSFSLLSLAAPASGLSSLGFLLSSGIDFFGFFGVESFAVSDAAAAADAAVVPAGEELEDEEGEEVSEPEELDPLDAEPESVSALETPAPASAAADIPAVIRPAPTHTDSCCTPRS
jgi:hypothetical protein